MTSEEQGERGSLDPKTLARLCALINARSGLTYNDSSQSLLERRLAVRLAARGLKSYSDYVDVLAVDREELALVFEILTTKETYFYRQEYQLQTFVDEVVPLLAAGRTAGARLTVWSAGCSSGEETYTLAMLLNEHPMLRGWKVRVVGTDLCASNIETAGRGVYRATSFRSISEENIARHFTKVDNGYQVSADLRRTVHFSIGNLIEAADVRAVGRVDVIFCRNVLIYFDQRSRQTATDLFYERLLPGGFLLLGHSESLLNSGTRFEPVQLKGDLVYRRPLLEQNSRLRKMNAS